jgi:AcrR family transcriptional regulator
MAVRTGRRAAKQPAEVRRETLVEAAIRVFARTAYRAAGTAEIAREAGVAEPTIYRHFDSKRDLYLAALIRCGEIVREHFARIDEETPLAREALEAMGAWYSEAMETDPAYLRLRQRALAETDDPEIQREVRACYKEILAIIARVMKRGQEQGTINPAISAIAGAWLFLAIGHTMDLARLIGLADDAGEDGCYGMTEVLKRALIAPRP